MIVYHDNWETFKGLKDASRHQEKIDEAIRKGVRDVIGNETIISSEGKKKVRIPVKGLKDYRFIHDISKESGGAGIGQGDRKPGDVIGKRQKQGNGGPGDGGCGSGDMNAEVDVDYLLDIMFEDLGLPWLDEKKKNSIEIPKGWRFESIAKKGVYARIHKKRTIKESLKRTLLDIKEIVNETYLKDIDFEEGQEKAEMALNQAKGDIEKAIKIINENKLEESSNTGFIINDEDLRFRQIEEDVEICSKAVIFALMDVSGSMTPDKKYLVKSLLFWMVSWLRKQYESVEIRFIQHTEKAKEVDEATFFYGGEYGGTLASTAFKKANDIIDNEYPLDEWNIYTIYCSDGEDFEPASAIDEIKVMLAKKINMLSYIEIKPDKDLFGGNVGYNYGYSTLLPEIRKKWPFNKKSINTNESNGDFWINKDLRFLLSVIKSKSHIWSCIKFMLGMKDENQDN